MPDHGKHKKKLIKSLPKGLQDQTARRNTRILTHNAHESPVVYIMIVRRQIRIYCLHGAEECEEDSQKLKRRYRLSPRVCLGTGAER